MIYYTSWLDNDRPLRIVQAQQNDAHAARYYEALRPLRHIIASIAAGFRLIWQNWQTRQRRRETINKLSSLDDRMLKDIGVTRAQIKAIASGTAPIIDKPSALPQHENVTPRTVTQSDCQIIPLPATERRRRFIEPTGHNGAPRQHVPSSAA